MPFRLFARCLVAALMLPLAVGRAQDSTKFTHADSLRGSNGPGRAWWDAAFYDLHVRVDPADSSIRGYNAVVYRVLAPGDTMQIDLRNPLVVDSIVRRRHALTYRRDGDALFVSLPDRPRVGALDTISVYYHGKPRVAHRAPWDGGFVWTRDSLGHTWIATANEGIGASVWWPNKELRADEPDSQRISITVPSEIVDVSNGRLRSTVKNDDGTTTYEWFVSSPINNYDVAVNAGEYTHLTDTFQGEKGKLTLDFWPLTYHADTARKQFEQVKPMLTCFEHWFGPYPWYADGYKLVETPHLGMEHQSAVAYGNHFKNGYLGRDLSATGWGMKWDFIIVHESGHEWFGNSITAQDPADMWVQEGFTNYAEGLFTECQSGKEAGAQYIIGSRRNIRNDKPIIAAFGVEKEGSGDMYYKTGSMLHMIRQVVNDDEKWRDILRGLNSTFYHKTVTGAEVRAYINQRSGIDFNPVFAQYLMTTQIPTLEYVLTDSVVRYRWTNVVPGFTMPVRVSIGGVRHWLRPTEIWGSTRLAGGRAGAPLVVDPDFYITTRELTRAIPDVSAGLRSDALEHNHFLRTGT
ncbi:MAG TPA: M1 family metallopeptidase [Gemmatimonadaceae bacterium]|nr:M1 family metallopeptidase [Gemmatimonadaceae bacterium]